MESEDLLLFPILVKRFPNFLTNEECQTIVSNIDQFTFTRHGSLTGDSRSNHNNGTPVYVLNVIDKVFPINERVFQVVNHYAQQQLGTKRLGIDNSWINIQGPGSELKPHTHPMSMVSGAMYLKLDSKSSGIKFINPNPYLDMVEVVERTFYMAKEMIIKPAVGDLLLFPSWLKHCADGENMSDERIVLSFNTGYIKK